MKPIFTAIFFFSTSLIIGCGGSPTNDNVNSNANLLITANTAANSNINAQPANIPSEFSTQPTQPPVNASGEAANATPVKVGPKPTPGIPNEAELKKGPKTGLTPTPGIPSPEELRRALGQRVTNTNANVQMSSNSNVPMMMKSNRPLGGRPRPTQP